MLSSIGGGLGTTVLPIWRPTRACPGSALCVCQFLVKYFLSNPNPRYNPNCLTLTLDITLAV